MSRYWKQDEAEQEAYEKHMQALYDEQCRMQQLAEEDACAERERVLRQEVLDLRAEVLDLRTEVLRERAAVVAWLRSDEPYRTWNDSTGGSEYLCAADCVERGDHRIKERGDHRREEEK